MSYFGDRIKKRRAELGLSLRQVSALAGISYQQVSNFENGDDPNPKVETINGLALALDLKSGDLFGLALADLTDRKCA